MSRTAVAVHSRVKLCRANDQYSTALVTYSSCSVGTRFATTSRPVVGCKTSRKFYPRMPYLDMLS